MDRKWRGRERRRDRREKRPNLVSGLWQQEEDMSA